MPIHLIVKHRKIQCLHIYLLIKDLLIQLLLDHLTVILFSFSF